MGRLTFDDWRGDDYRDSLADIRDPRELRMTLEQHLRNNAAAIEAEALERSANYNLPIDEAREQVLEGWSEAWHEDNDARRNGDYPFDGSFAE